MLLLWYFLIAFAAQQTQSHDIVDILQKEITEYVRTNKKPENLQNVINEFYNTTNKIAKDKMYCTACVIVGNAIVNLRKSGISNDVFANITKEMCIMFTSYSFNECSNYMNLALENILYILDNKKDISVKRFCAIRLQDKNCVDDTYIPWNITIPPGKSVPLPKKNDEKLNEILHLTDVHIDLLYQAGSAAICNDSLCCQKNTSGIPAAGYWGDYNICDMPWYSVEDLLTQIKEQHPNIDWIYFTGDIMNHYIWDTSNEYNSRVISKLFKKLSDTFGNVPVYSVLGNHEVHPVDFYSMTNMDYNLTSTQSLYKLAAEEWIRWLPADTMPTILKGGYYTVLVRPGFRIIGLNNNICLVDNVWLAFRENDPYEQLQWLANTLFIAENNLEAVHIIAHIPPGNLDCFKQWNNEFVKIVNRFHNTITGQFYGHTHLDEFRVFYDNFNPVKVINVAFISGSFTTFIGFNPSYKLYETGSGHNRVINYEQWTYNLCEANKNPVQKPKWFKQYSFKDAYAVDKLELSSFDEIVQNMINNITILENYQRFSVRNSPAALNKPCDNECLTNIFCGITNINYDDSTRCKEFKQKHHKV